jgi:haloalkane dehalogenase
VNAADHHRRQRIGVLDTEMSDVDPRNGDPIVCLHGNPTSSDLWRNSILRILAAMDAVSPPTWSVWGKRENAQGHPGAARPGLGARFLASVPPPRTGEGHRVHAGHPPTPPAADFPKGRGTLFRAMRSEDSEEGEPLVLDANVFIETVLAKSIIRQLKRARDACHRAPFRDRAARRPTLIWPRELPIEGEPADVVALRDFVTGVTS